MEKEPHPLSLSLLARVCLIIGSRVYCICLDVACSLPRTRKRKSHTSTPLAKNLPGTNERTALFYSMYTGSIVGPCLFVGGGRRMPMTPSQSCTLQS